MAKLSYWEKRALARQNAYDRSAAKTLRTVQVAYGRAEAQITQDMEKILRSFRENYGLTREQALRILHEPYSREILDRLRAMARRMENGPQKRAVMAELNAAAYKARISRLEAAQLSAKTNMALVADAEIKAGTEGMLVTARDAFDRMMFDLQKESGVMFRSTGMSVSRAREILKTNWSGQSFSRRVWRNTDHVSTVLSQALEEMAMAGKVSDAGQLEIWSVLKKELKENLQQGRLASQRLLMTEWNYVTNQAEKEAMEDCGMEKYQFMAVLDSRTSEICQELDGKIFNLADAKPGVNYPPMHPWCRSLAVAVIDEKYRKTMTRRATDPETGEIEEVPYDMNYREWKEWKEKGAEHGGSSVEGNTQNEIVSKVSKRTDLKSIDNSAMINAPIESRNNGKGNPSAVAFLGRPLNKRQQRILDQLPDYGSKQIVKKRDVSMRDLSALTAHTGDEFAMFTKGGKRMIVRGNRYDTPVTTEDAMRLCKEGYRWSGHTHPGIDRNSLQPSDGDHVIIRVFAQKRSVIVNSAGQYDQVWGDD